MRRVAVAARRAAPVAAIVAARPLSTAVVGAARSRMTPFLTAAGASLIAVTLASSSCGGVDYDAVRLRFVVVVCRAPCGLWQTACCVAALGWVDAHMGSC